MKNQELFSLNIRETGIIQIGFVNSLPPKKGGKAKILSKFKEDRSKLMFADDFLVLENATQFDKKLEQGLYITNRCNGISFTPSSKKFIVIKKELISNFHEIFKYYCNKKNVAEPQLICIKEMTFNQFQKVFLYEIDSNDFCMHNFPRYISDLKSQKQNLDRLYKDTKSEKRFCAIKDGVKTFI
jgi:hypothetical protein